MAIFRKIHTSFWSDSFISDLDKDKKLFYIYLLTNERTKQCGVYEITKKQISFDLGYSIDTVSKLLEYFIKCGKLKYNDVTKEVAIGNWLKYNDSTSPKVKSCINKEFEQVKDRVLIEYVKSIDTQSQEEEEQEQKQKEEEEQDLIDDYPSFDEFWNLYDKKTEREKCENKWNKLKQSEKEKIMQTLPKYVASTPEKAFRKNPSTYLHNKCWNDEIIIKPQQNNQPQQQKPQGATNQFYRDPTPEDDRIKRLKSQINLYTAKVKKDYVLGVNYTENDLQDYLEKKIEGYSRNQSYL